MSSHICPWWLTYTFDNPLRRLLHDPVEIVGPYVREGMRVADIGCGMGYFTPTLATLVGPKGHVQAVDLQRQQLARVQRRCERAGVAERLELKEASFDRLGLDAPLHFVLAFWMAHEVPNAERFLTEIKAGLATGGTVLIVEPKLHVSKKTFEAFVDVCRHVGLAPSPAHHIRASRGVVLSAQS